MPQIGAPRQRGGNGRAATGGTNSTMSDMTASPSSTTPRPRFTSFSEFYPFYLAQHAHPTSRRLHVAGTLLASVIGALAWLRGTPALLPWALAAGYLPAWAGHFIFEHNAPATFRHPLYSLCGDLRMLGETLTGRRRW